MPADDPPAVLPPEGTPPEGTPPEGTPTEGTPPEGTPPEGTPPERTPTEGRLGDDGAPLDPRVEAALDAALSREGMLPVPPGLVARVVGAVRDLPAYGPLHGRPTEVPAAASRFASRRAAPWRIAAAVAVVALGAHLLSGGGGDALASVQPLASLRLPLADAATAPIADALRVGGGGLRDAAPAVPALPDGAAFAAVSEGVPGGPAVLLAGGAGFLALGVALAAVRGRRAAGRSVR